jgi:hypothetical protein
MLIRSAAVVVPVMMAQVAAALTVPPLPPPRPIATPSPATPPAPRAQAPPAPTANAPPAAPAAEDCLAGLKAAGFEIEPAEPPQVSNDLCRIDTPVRLKARGTPQHPGLVLELDRGGSCWGVAFRIARSEAEAELELVWRREMVTGAYVPR